MPSQPHSPAVTKPPEHPRIVLCYPVGPRHIAQIEAAAPHAEVIDAGQERIDRGTARGRYFLRPRQGAGALGRSRAARPPSLDSILGRRARSLPRAAVIESDITVTSASGVLANQVADHTMALLAGLLRSLPTYFRAQQKREFIRRPTRRSARQADRHHRLRSQRPPAG